MIKHKMKNKEKEVIEIELTDKEIDKLIVGLNE